jgi:hypothetical protein
MKLARCLMLMGCLAWAGMAAGQEEIRCKDGTTGVAGLGACKHHGGVDHQASIAKAESQAKKAQKKTKSTDKVAATTLHCKDGTTGAAGKHACAHHGGVDTSDDTAADHKPPAPPPMSASPTAPSASPTPAQRGPTARCKDGTLSYDMHTSGTCSDHGGVGEWLDGSHR